MKELIQSLAAYNIWANRQLFDAALQLDPALHEQTVPSSFPTLKATFMHMWDAESGWWQRLQNHEHIVIPSKTFHTHLKDVANGLLGQNQIWQDWTHGITEESLHTRFSYTNTKGAHFEQPVWQMALHLFNHGTYHRGQVVTILRHLGLTSIPSTDFIIWSRA